jgi:hypothetical protein
VRVHNATLFGEYIVHPNKKLSPTRKTQRNRCHVGELRDVEELIELIDRRDWAAFEVCLDIQSLAQTATRGLSIRRNPSI